jgi:ribosomal protein S18 acetylase RimI-like enzyme
MVRLVPMDANDFEPFLENLVQEYAKDHIRSGRWTEEEGPSEARKEVERLIPTGLDTPGQFFFTIMAGQPEEKVGALWFAVEPRGGFIYDLLVFEPYRRRGYAEAAMVRLESVAREKGVRKLALHVFGDNGGARKLYSKLGYSETNVVMAKSLAP